MKTVEEQQHEVANEIRELSEKLSFAVTRALQLGLEVSIQHVDHPEDVGTLMIGDRATRSRFARRIYYPTIARRELL